MKQICKTKTASLLQLLNFSEEERSNIKSDNLSSGYNCTRRFHLSHLSLCVFDCVSLQWLYPQRRQTAALWKRKRRRGTVNLPPRQRNRSSLKWVQDIYYLPPWMKTRPHRAWTHTHTHACMFIDDSCCAVLGVGVCRVCGRGQPAGVDIYPLRLWQ